MTPGSLSRCVGALLEECQKFEGERTLMRIHIGESDKWRGKPLYEAIVEMLRKEGFSGATVLRGVGGYGGSSVYHRQNPPPFRGVHPLSSRVEFQSGINHPERGGLVL